MELKKRFQVIRQSELKWNHMLSKIENKIPKLIFFE